METLSLIRPRTLQTLKKAVIAGLCRGPLVGGEIINTQVILHSLVIGRGIADSFLMSATAQCIQKILSKAGCCLLEPIMKLQIIVPNDRSSAVIQDLSRRRAEIIEIVPRGQNKVSAFLK